MQTSGLLIQKKVRVVLGVVLVGLMGGCASRPAVLVTGYWPPTNEMLVPFSNDEALNPDGWQGKNWQGLGYDVYAYFPTFPDGTDANPCGEGDFQVDYQDTLKDFQRLSGKLKPVAILCYGLGEGPWEIEHQAVYRPRWRDDYRSPKQPEYPGTGDGQGGQVIGLSLPVESIQAAVSDSLPELNAWIDWQGNPGDFLCNYMALLAADYQVHHSHCRMAGFIHVGPGVDVETAQKAQEITLKTILKELNHRSAAQLDTSL